MNTKHLEAIIASPPERDEIVVQLFQRNGGQWGEVFRKEGIWRIELFQQADGNPWPSVPT